MPDKNVIERNVAEGIELTKAGQPLFADCEDIFERHVDPLLGLANIEMMPVLIVARYQMFAELLVPVVERLLINDFVLKVAQAAYALIEIISYLDIEAGFCLNHAQAVQRAAKVAVGTV